jgi:hypothetical protein
MLNVSSKLWQVRSYNDAYADITQIASKTIRVVARSKLPSAERIAAMTERQFDSMCREAFHNAAK